MRNEDKPEFAQLLGNVMASYGKPLPDGGMVGVWFNVLAPFQPAVIARAFSAYALERPDHAPAPNSIAARCRLLDGRPDENEAWAVALTTRGEEETVVWTEEMRDAFHACQPVLAAGDEIGARMAFKDAYARLVSEARAANKPAVWVVSEGWDKTRKAVVLAKAQRDGLLPAPPAHLALAQNGISISGEPAGRPEGLKRVLDEVAKLEDPFRKAERIRDARVAAAFQAEQARTRDIDQQVRAYQRQAGAGE
jgi:hypothetical protein